MYYQNYEDYIRNILGYPVQSNINQISNSTYNNYEYITNRPTYDKNILDLYPEIYKIINPMVCKICEANTKPITNELLEQMTDEIYLNIENDNSEISNSNGDVVNIRVNVPKEQNNNSNRRRQSDINRNNSEISSVDNKKTDKENNKENENRQIRRRNPMLRDLIRILILNQLLFGHNRPPHNRPRYPNQRMPYNSLEPRLYNF